MMSSVGITIVAWSLDSASCSRRGSSHSCTTTQCGSMKTIIGLSMRAAPITFARISPCRTSFRWTCTFGCKARSSSWCRHPSSLPSSMKRIWSTRSNGLCARREPTVALICTQVSFRYGITSEACGRAARLYCLRTHSWCLTSGGVGKCGKVPVKTSVEEVVLSELFPAPRSAACSFGASAPVAFVFLFASACICAWNAAI
mmetsp:Transcript_16595/g.29044  ORF Transcript_16595/g.29044 Transcript_16595/m.29044 type:complete len:201 (-) Transcript_16595:492-1094(-)